MSGDVVVEGLTGDLDLRSESGDEFATTSGDIALTIPEQPDAKMSAATFSGRFSSDLSTTQDERRRNRHRYSATWGSGSARLDLESLSGNIRITVGSR